MNNKALHDNAFVDRIVTTENIRYYREQGFLVCTRMLSGKEVQDILEETLEIFTGQRGEIDGLVAPEGDLRSTDLVQQYAAIHFPHKISEKIREYARHVQIAGILQSIIGANVKCMQTMLFMKAPGKKGQSWHQDEFYIPTRDKSLTGGWLALDDANIDNGCLWVIPGSHREGFIRNRISYTGDEYADVDMCDLHPYTEHDFLPVEVPAGSVVFFNGYLLHSSLRNKTTNRYRRALVSHYCSAESMLPWDQDGRMEKTDDFRDIFMVCGKDPYEYKGVANISHPFVRPDVLDFATKEYRVKKRRNTGQ